MTRRVFTVLMLSLVPASAAAQQSCLEPASLVSLDRQWETALLESNAGQLDALLADDFVWVHNHASMVDTKASVLARASDPGSGAARVTRSRVSSDVEARVLGSTGVVSGFTVVDRGHTPTRYSFMRTYAEVAGRCLLFANQTMAIPEAEGRPPS